MRLRKHAQAKRDIVEHAAYIAHDNPEAAVRFMDAVEEALQQLKRMPFIGSTLDIAHPRLTGLRTWRIHGFEQHLIFYLPQENSIDVVRVLHAKRDIDTALGEDA